MYHINVSLQIRAQNIHQAYRVVILSCHYYCSVRVNILRLQIQNITAVW